MLPRQVLSAGPLVLRPPSAEDLDAIVRTCNDPEIQRFLPLLPSPYGRQDAEAYLKIAADKCAEFTITRDGAYVGAIGLRSPDAHGSAEMGYLVAPWARGQDVAGTAARAVAEWALDHGLQRVELQTEVENVAGLRVALKAGFHEEGRRRDAKRLRDGRLADLVTFGRVPRDSGEPAEPYLPFFPGGELSDGVVRLTPIGIEDAADYHRMMNEPSVAAYTVGRESTLEDDERRMRYTGYWWASGQRIELAVRDAASGAFAGHLQLAQVTQVLGQGMVGYSLVPEFRGRGFMTRAVNLLVEWVFANTAVRRIVAGTEVANTASQMVLTRAGFSREGLQRELFPAQDGTYADDVEWLRLRPKNM
ncbi:GNAT family N-acetyltransferase [Nonomuraea sp. NPDC050536]|uniref:GNAT family N-acetyltransferase n=1 Tax=Nonomuraea sp. NPDC050536 TaxID=3364366 RepID=UPI0037C74628